MKNRIIEIEEIGFPRSLILRDGAPISELINTTDLINELFIIAYYNQLTFDEMRDKKTLKLILKSVGLELVDYKPIIDCVDVVGCEFEVRKNGKFEFSVEAYSLEDAIKETIQCISESYSRNLKQ
jgi:hypothetical protein